MNDWMGYLNTVAGTEIWGFVALDYYQRGQLNDVSPSEFLTSVIQGTKVPRETDAVEFHRTLLAVSVQLLGAEFEEIYQKSLQFLEKMEHRTSERMRACILHYEDFGRKAEFEEFLTSSGNVELDPAALTANSNYQEFSPTFISYNNQDFEFAASLAEALRGLGLATWIDQADMRPGNDWLDELEKIIDKCSAAVICIGSNGIGKWEDQEIKALQRRRVGDPDSTKPIKLIPVLIPGGSQVELPKFLNGLTSVDFTAGITTKALNQLKWGITGEKT